MEFNFNLGKALKTLKAQYDITNNDIAQVTGKSSTTVSQWINGKQFPSLGTLEDLCFSCEVQLSEFIKWGE